MSRMTPCCEASPESFPRVSGDEPVDLGTEYTITEFSPRERG